MSSFKINENHIRVFIEFMEENPDLARGRLSCSNARDKFRQLWSRLAINLNSLGYGTRTIEKWQRTWSDYKLGLKKRASDIKKELVKTGGGPVYPGKLSENDERALALLGQAFFEGCGVEEKGFPLTNLNEQGQRNIQPNVGNSDLFAPGPSNILSEITVVQEHHPMTEPTWQDARIFAKPGPAQENVELKEQTNRQSMASQKVISRKRQQDDHDYIASPRDKNRKITPSITAYYQETIDLLRNIDHRLENIEEIFLDINNTLKEKLGDISNAIRHRI